jgi:hypothetical protein
MQASKPELHAMGGRPLGVVEVETSAHDAAGHLQEGEGGGGLCGEEL